LLKSSQSFQSNFFDTGWEVFMPRILIIDDDADFRTATRMVMEHEGYEVIWAGNGKDGYEKALVLDPDLVILDVMMETTLEGLFLTKRIHNHPQTKDIPILMVSSFTEAGYSGFLEGEYNYIDSFLNKPVNPERLLNRVRSLLV
jgi:DNA-binding response OmpR family regulator